jgi:hypothetical protein
MMDRRRYLLWAMFRVPTVVEGMRGISSQNQARHAECYTRLTKGLLNGQGFGERSYAVSSLWLVSPLLRRSCSL